MQMESLPSLLTIMILRWRNQLTLSKSLQRLNRSVLTLHHKKPLTKVSLSVILWGNLLFCLILQRLPDLILHYDSEICNCHIWTVIYENYSICIIVRYVAHREHTDNPLPAEILSESQFCCSCGYYLSSEVFIILATNVIKDRTAPFTYNRCCEAKKNPKIKNSWSTALSFIWIKGKSSQIKLRGLMRGRPHIWTVPRHSATNKNIRIHPAMKYLKQRFNVWTS